LRNFLVPNNNMTITATIASCQIPIPPIIY
jgi:hypothetical protein